MAEILKGMPVVKAMNDSLIKRVEKLKEGGVEPVLGILRIGERPDDISYERGACKRCDAVGVGVKKFILPLECTEEDVISQIQKINQDDSIHGLLLFRPLPKHMNENKVSNSLDPSKDLDGITDISLAGVFSGRDLGYPPCTPAACMELLDFYQIDVTGKNIAVIGRSLVVGKPVSMMLTHQNATVTLCHTKTRNLADICKRADILVVAAGHGNTLRKEHLKPEHIVLDVGINFTEEGNLCGDVNFSDAEPIVSAVTPVPGGIGTVTTSVLVKHLVDAAEKRSII